MKKRLPDYFKKLGQDKFQCIICHKIYAGFASQHSAKNCCKEFKPASEKGLALKQAQKIIESNPRTKLPLTKRRTDKHRQPDEHGHHYRGKEPVKVLATAYHRAWDKAKKEEEEKVLNEIFAGYDPMTGISFHDYLKESKATPLQKLAYGYYLRNYEMVKAAAYELSNRKLAFYIRRQALQSKSGREIATAYAGGLGI